MGLAGYIFPLGLSGLSQHPIPNFSNLRHLAEDIVPNSILRSLRRCADRYGSLWRIDPDIQVFLPCILNHLVSLTIIFLLPRSNVIDIVTLLFSLLLFNGGIQ